MRPSRLIPFIALAFAAACNEQSNTPVDSSPLPDFAIHFIGSPSCTQVGSNLSCNFKVAGLGNISTATVTVQAPFTCAKTTNGEQDVRPGGLASSSQSGVPVSNGQITVTGFTVTGGRCPDGFAPDFGTTATLIINGTTVGTIPIT
jgi:hypothetical protein